MQYRPIKSLAQYKAYESYLEKLLWIKNKSASDQEAIQHLISLIRIWDADHHTVSSMIPAEPRPDPVKVLDQLMKENRVNASDLASALGMSQSGISDILNYRKELSADIISKLAEQFKVSEEIFG